MRAAVRDAFTGFTAQYEGVVPWMYLDILGLVTVGIGNLIDPLSAAIGLPFVDRVTGAPASRDAIVAEWLRVKGDGSLARLGHRAAERMTSLRLTDEGVAHVVSIKVAQNDAVLSKRLPDWEEFPACAQLAMHSWSWACGPNGAWPRLFEALNARDFDAASVHVQIPEWSKTSTGASIRNTGIIPRNVANKLLMRNAARVQAFHLDPDLLDWVHDLDVSNVETQTEITNPASEPTIYAPIIHVGGDMYRLDREPEDDPDDAA